MISLLTKRRVFNYTGPIGWPVLGIGVFPRGTEAVAPALLALGIAWPPGVGFAGVIPCGRPGGA